MQDSKNEAVMLVASFHKFDAYYGEPKLWFRGNEKVIKIEKDERRFIFYVTVQVRTFEGAHDLPYGEDTMTFRIKGGQIKMIHFKHRDVPEEELTKSPLR